MTPDALAQEVAEGIFEMHSRLALRERSTDALAETMTQRALDGAEISANGRFLLFSAIRHALMWELRGDDVRRIGGQ